MHRFRMKLVSCALKDDVLIRDADLLSEQTTGFRRGGARGGGVFD